MSVSESFRFYEKLFYKIRYQIFCFYAFTSPFKLNLLGRQIRTFSFVTMFTDFEEKCPRVFEIVISRKMIMWWREIRRL